MYITVMTHGRVEVADGADGFTVADFLQDRHTFLGMIVNGEMKDLSCFLKEEDNVEMLDFQHNKGKYMFWHTSAHVLAQAILRLYPNALPTIGPPIENGFYYDFANLNISENDFQKIEKEAKKILSKKYPTERIEHKDTVEAFSYFGNNPFKKELLEVYAEEGLSSYKQGEFIDLCRGPHIPHLGFITAFKVLKTSGAYWRADTNNEQLTRVYAISFPSKEMLQEYIYLQEEAKKRDHRIVGKKLKLFAFHQEAPGMPFFYPKGIVLWKEIIDFWNKCHANDYLEIKTPALLSKDLWVQSGHWDNYRENMYTSQIDDIEFAIKPMNCPGCMLFFNDDQYSYRNLPLRVAEIGHVHRHEMSGALSGLFRVRSFHQDDAHLFMENQDIEHEVHKILILAEKIYSQFGLQYHLELSTRPKKSIGTTKEWDITTKALQQALEIGKYNYIVNEGDGAFYGPKIDLHIKDALGRTWQCGTIQLDMLLPERFDISYIARDGKKKRPIMIHRTILGSIERFMGILIEHYSGKFPLWLSPEQIRILPVADRHREIAESIATKIQDHNFRVFVDASAESISKKVRNGQMMQTNYILVVGDKEKESGNINIRGRSHQTKEMDIGSFLSSITEEKELKLSQTTIF